MGEIFWGRVVSLALLKSHPTLLFREAIWKETPLLSDRLHHEVGWVLSTRVCSSLTLLLPWFKEVTGTPRGMWSLGLRQHGVIENNFLFYGLLGLVHVNSLWVQREE